MTVLRRKLLTVLIVLGMIATIYAGVTAFHQAQARRAADKFDALAAKTAEACLANHADAADKPALLRSCIHADASLDKDDEIQRNDLLLGALHKAGFSAHAVITAKFAKDFPEFRLVEVWNEDRKAWEAHDANYDVIFRMKGNPHPLSVTDMVALGPDKFVPCLPGNVCGWANSTDDDQALADLKDYWGMMVAKSDKGEWRLVYNPDNFDPQKPVDGKNYCTAHKAICRLSPVSLN